MSLATFTDEKRKAIPSTLIATGKALAKIPHPLTISKKSYPKGNHLKISPS